ncbi:MAG: hypothetical protein WB715_26900 [Roseiarcus sp.]|uniref:hypothetical protein n=1 Tax=Roseiarcus sp. TaxID=1969460 RepID=UPI003C40FD25
MAGMTHLARPLVFAPLLLVKVNSPLIRPGLEAFGKYLATNESAASPRSFTAWALAEEEIARSAAPASINLFIVFPFDSKRLKTRHDRLLRTQNGSGASNLLW